MRVRLDDQRLREILARSRLSQNAWAIRVGVSRGHWSDLVNGKHPYPSAGTRERILEALGVEFDELFRIESPEGADATGELEAGLADRYVIDEEVGEGAMGVVFRARDVRFGRTVAIKAVSPEAISDLGSERFLKEIHRLGRLGHPNVLPLLDAGEAAGRPYYVTPFVEEGSLRDRIAESGRLSPEETVEILRGVAAALEHAHGRGLLHCDVKPENILLVGDHAYVADFGLARAVHIQARREWERLPEIDTAAGTPAYVSPEQARAGRELDPRSDVYSLACVAFEMLCGQPPFQGNRTSDVVRRRFDTVVPTLKNRVSGIPDAVADVVATGMSVEARDRPSGPRAFLDRLEMAVELTHRRTASEPSLTNSALNAVSAWAVTRAPRPRGAFVSSLVNDVRYSIRSLLRRPLFAMIVVATLALGIGVNAAIFSVVDAAVLSPLPYPEPDELVRIYGAFEGEICCSISAPNFVDMRRQSEEFEDLGAYSSTAYALTAGGEAVRVFGNTFTHGMFELLGARPQLGRFFTEEDDTAGAEPVVVLSDRFWRDRFEADPGVIGETVIIDTVPHTVIGVAPPGFRISGRPQIFTPFAWDATSMPSRGSNFLNVIGRVADGSTIEQAMAELKSIQAGIVEQYPTLVNKGVGHLPLREVLVGEEQRERLLMLWGAVAMVLLVACANVINLMLARAEARQQELAVRAALGAGRGRLLRHFMTESMLVALVGATVGVAAAYGGLQALLSAYGGAVPRSAEIGLDATVLLFTLGVALVTGVIVGLVPALLSHKKGYRAALQEGTRGSSSGSGVRLRQGLVVVQVAAALVLVIGAGLMLKSFWRLGQVELGVDGSSILTARVSLPGARYQQPADIVDFYDRLKAEVERLPGVESVGLASAVPFSNTWTNFSEIMPEGNPDVTASFVEVRSVGPDYFEALGLDLIAGGIFDGTEWIDTEPLVVVNEELVRQLFPDTDPIGRAIASGPTATSWRIIGVVENVRDHGPDREIPPTVFFSSRQRVSSAMSLAVETTGPPLDLVPSLRDIVAELDPEVPLHGIERLDRLVSEGLGGRRFMLSLLGVFGGLALALGAVGIYGVMAYSVERRTREIGLRQALGATRSKLVGLVMRQGVALALVGIGIGSLLAYYLRQNLADQLFEVEGFDPPTYVAVAGLLTLVAAAACFVPALRASRLDPMEALREE